jgi:protease I
MKKTMFILVIVIIGTLLIVGCPPKPPEKSGEESETTAQTKDTAKEVSTPADNEMEVKKENMGKILMIIASSNFRDEEYEEPRKVLQDAGYEIEVASSKLDVSTGMLGITVQPDLLLENVVVDNYIAIIFIGGGGASEYWSNPTAHNIARDVVNKGKVLGAICIAPQTLANAGLLNGKKVCGFESITSGLAQAGAIVETVDVVVDGNIVTASGPEAATPFGIKIREMLK